MLRSRRLKLAAAMSGAVLMSGCAGGELGGMVGALGGGLLAGMYTEGDMNSITAGMAVGAEMLGQGSEISNATGANLRETAERVAAETAREEEINRRTIAALNAPDGAYTRGRAAERERAEARRAEEAATREREEAERRAAERRAVADTASLNAAQADSARADLERYRAETARVETQRAEEARRAEAERVRRNEAEARERRAAEERAARERRAAEAREARERARAEAEAERNRLIDFPEVIVLCSLVGREAERGNWRCQGGLQTTYAKLDTAEAALPLGQACGTRSPPRELGSTGGYRAFGCGFGMVRGGVGAYSDPATRLGVGYVPNRAVFRCPASRSGESCRDR